MSSRTGYNRVFSTKIEHISKVTLQAVEKPNMSEFVFTNRVFPFNGDFQRFFTYSNVASFKSFLELLLGLFSQILHIP